jgi:hypothetical protein
VLLRRNRFLRVREEIRDEVQLLRAAEERRRQLLARPGPLAAWDFEGMTDTVVPDVSGNGFHASVVGTVTCESGRAGQGLRLTGSSYLRLDEPVFFNLQDLTLSLWIRPDEVKGRHGLIAKRFAGAAAPFVLSLWDGALEFEATDTNGAWSFNFRSPPVVIAGTWTHVAAVAQRGKGVTLYANGRPVAGKENALDRVANDEPLILGREAWAGVNMVHEPCYFVGLVDEVRVWARALSAAEVQAEFSRLPAP